MNFVSLIVVGFLGAGQCYLVTIYTKEMTCQRKATMKPCFKRKHMRIGDSIFKYVFTMELIQAVVQLALFCTLLFTSLRLYHRMVKFHD